MLEVATSPEIQATYDAIWARGEAALAAGQVEVDPHLADRTADRRRGATLVIRPSAAVQAAVADVLAGLAQAEPGQHYYRPDELHGTVLSLFTANEHPEADLARLPAYRAAIAGVLAATPPFRIRFAGVTASPAAVLVQGCLEPDPVGVADADPLNCLRERLRSAFAAAGLADGLDRRYRITTAHMTALRYAQPLCDSAALLARLQALRTHSFGVTTVETLHLVTNDWYMSRDRVQVVERFGLPFTSSRG
jgi:2'-5' RNA ligase